MNAPMIAPGQGEMHNVLGTDTLIRLDGRQTDGRFSLFEIVCPPDRFVPPHVHAREDELFHVLSGRIVFTRGEESFTAGPGTTVYFPRGTWHGFAGNGIETGRMLVQTTPSGIEDMFRELGRLDPESPPDPIFEICARYDIKFRKS